MQCEDVPWLTIMSLLNEKHCHLVCVGQSHAIADTTSTNQTINSMACSCHPQEAQYRTVETGSMSQLMSNESNWLLICSSCTGIYSHKNKQYQFSANMKNTRARHNPNKTEWLCGSTHYDYLHIYMRWVGCVLFFVIKWKKCEITYVLLACQMQCCRIECSPYQRSWCACVISFEQCLSRPVKKLSHSLIFSFIVRYENCSRNENYHCEFFGIRVTWEKMLYIVDRKAKETIKMGKHKLFSFTNVSPTWHNIYMCMECHFFSILFSFSVSRFSSKSFQSTMLTQVHPNAQHHSDQMHIYIFTFACVELTYMANVCIGAFSF